MKRVIIETQHIKPEQIKKLERMIWFSLSFLALIWPVSLTLTPQTQYLSDPPLLLTVFSYLGLEVTFYLSLGITLFLIAPVIKKLAKMSRSVAIDQEAILQAQDELTEVQKQLEEKNAELEEHQEELEYKAKKEQEAREYAEVQTSMHEHASKRFQSLFEGLPVGCMTYDPTGTIFEWNQMASELFNREAHFALMMPITMILDQEDKLELIQETLQKSIHEGEHITMDWEVEIECEKKILSLSFFPLQEHNGNVIGGICCALDVTVQREAEQKISEMARFQGVILDSTDYCMISTDETGLVTGFNKAASEQLGYQPSQVVKKMNYLDFLSASELIERVDDSEEFSLENQDEVFAEFVNYSLSHDVEEWKYVKSDLNEFDAEVEITKLEGEGDLAGYLFVAKDVTVQKQIEERLELLSMVAKETTNGVLICDSNKKILFCNPAFEKLSLTPSEEIVGQSPSVFFCCEDCFDEDRCEFTEALNLQLSVDLEVQLHRPENKLLWTNVSTTPIRNHDGETEYFVIIANDISQRKEYEIQIHRSEQRFRDVVDAAGEYIWETDTRLAFTYISDQFTEVLGYTNEDISGLKATSFIFPEDRVSLEEALCAALLSGEPVTNVLCRGVHKDGSTIWLRINALPIFAHDYSVIGFRGTGLDITEQKEFELALDHAREEMHGFLESIRDSFWAFDADLNYKYMNKAALESYGLELEEVVGKSFSELNIGSDWKTVAEKLEEARHAHQVSVFEVFFQDWLVWFEFRVYPNRDRGVSVFYQDITERKALLQEIEDRNAELSEAKISLEIQQEELQQANVVLRSLASTDGLTGLNNHKTFQEFLSKHLEESAPNGESVCVILMDVDKFKPYNDTYGHVAGDDVLKGVAKTLKEVVSEPNLVARYGGEEFVIVTVGLDPDEAVALANEARAAIADQTWPNREITASFGVAQFGGEIQDKQTLIEMADAALYVSKESGRNQVTFWTPDLDQDRAA